MIDQRLKNITRAVDRITAPLRRIEAQTARINEVTRLAGLVVRRAIGKG